MNIAVIGTGYVGLVTGTCLAHIGHNVSCIDIDESKVASMLAGKLPIYEPGLQDIFSQVLAAKRLTITTKLSEGIKDADAIYLALPTPSGDNGSADLTAVLAVAEQLGQLLKKYTVIINKSTVPVGTGKKVSELIGNKTTTEYDVVSNPEFLREGIAVEDFLHPDRIVLGLNSDRALEVMKQIYGPFITKTSQIVIMDIPSAEMTKYAANSFLAMKVSFMNEMANLCEKVGANIDSIRLGIGPDPRIGNMFLHAGIGYGGSCFPKDIQALLSTAKDNNYRFRLLESIIDINTQQKVKLVEKLQKYYKNNLTDKNIAIWGLAFKPNTDDIRESPALYIIDSLLEQGATVTAYDPKAMINTKRKYENRDGINFVNSSLDATKDADALLIVTEWEEFNYPNFNELKTRMKSPAIFDGRNLYQPEELQKLSFHYESIGRKGVKISAQK